jgi:hypothetical protein
LSTQLFHTYSALYIGEKMTKIVPRQAMRLPSERLLRSSMTIGITLIVVGVVLGIWHGYYDYLSPHYAAVSHVYQFQFNEPPQIQLHTGIRWYECSAAILIGWVIAGVTYHYSEKFYNYVGYGKVVRIGDYTESYGTRIYYAVIEGNNLAGQLTTYVATISQTTWRDLKVGGMLTLS